MSKLDSISREEAIKGRVEGWKGDWKHVIDGLVERTDLNRTDAILFETLMETQRAAMAYEKLVKLTREYMDDSEDWKRGD